MFNIHQISLRKEEQQDHKTVEQLIESAFRNEQYSDHKEHLLVSRLRKSKAFVPELSIVAEYQNNIVGHILLTKINIVNNNNQKFPSLALAPVSVLPEYQAKGIGSKLILHAHQVAFSLNHESIILLGHQDYYPRFGYKKCGTFGIRLPFDVPEENCMAIELIENSLKGINGTVKYDPCFFQ